MIAMIFDSNALACDLAAGPNGIVRDDGLTTAVLLSLFTDARAWPDDPLPAAGDRRGWWGDGLVSGPAADRIGSRLWLLCREKQTEETRRRAEDYAREALQWLVEDGAARSVAVVAEWVQTGVLGLLVMITGRAGGVWRTGVTLGLAPGANLALMGLDSGALVLGGRLVAAQEGG